MKSKNKGSPKGSDPAKKSAAPKGSNKGIFKQPLQKPQPWSFGGRGERQHDEGAKAQPDAERLAGKSRKVH